MSRPIQPSSIAIRREHLLRRIGRERAPADAVLRQQQLAAGLLAGGDRATGRLLALLVLVQRAADAPALRDRERVRHGAADQDRVGGAGEALDHADLVGDLDAAGDHHERVRRVVEQLAEHLELAAQQVAGGRGQQRRDGRDGGVRPMRGAEGVVDVDVGERGERGREGRVVLLLARVEAQVLEQQHVALGELRPPAARPPGRCSPPRSARDRRAARRAGRRPAAGSARAAPAPSAGRGASRG